MGDTALFYTFVALTLIIVLLLIQWYNDYRGNKFKKELFKAVDNTIALEDMAKGVLQKLAKFIKAQTYSVYNKNTLSGSYILNISEKSESYTPSLVLEGVKPEKNVFYLVENKLHFYYLSFFGDRVIVRLGPCKSFSYRTYWLLKEVLYILRPIIKVSIELQNAKGEGQRLANISRAVDNISEIVKDNIHLIATNLQMLNMVTSSKLCLAGFWLNEENIIYSSEQLNIAETISLFESLENEEYIIIKQGLPGYSNMSRLFADYNGRDTVVAVATQAKTAMGVILLFFEKDYEFDQHQLHTIRLMSARLNDMIEGIARFKQVSNMRYEMLEALANMLDNINELSVGYSEMMVTYCDIIAGRMNLKPEYRENLLKAAYLSNIGTLGLSKDLIFKKGQYQKHEYEIVKLHSVVGASIIEAVTGDINIARIVRHHHERIDGYGYPDNIKGELIPIESQIISVVQTFVAKVRGRNYRDPMPFNKAIELLRETSGTQHSRSVVDAFVGWLEDKRRECKKTGKALGNCWELRSSPVCICKTCPAYLNYEINCWDQPDNNCSAHGNECNTCFIYSEFKTR